MISINNINKIQYDDKNDSIVEVMEYMIINESDGKNHIVFKLRNNTLQVLHSFSLFVEEYNDNDQKIAEEIIEIHDLNILTGEIFIPKAKLSVSINCKKIFCKLKEAEFDNMKYKDGVCFDFIFDQSSKENLKSQKKLKKELALIKKIQKKNAKKKKQKVKVKEIKPLFGKWVVVMTFIFCVLGGISFSVIPLFANRFINSSNISFKEGNYTYSYLDNDKTIIGIKEYSGKDEIVNIPEEINGHPVKRIFNKAFSNSIVKTIKFNGGEIQIDGGAFYQCLSLEKIEDSSLNTKVTFSDYSFIDCNNIQKILLQNSIFNSNSLYGLNLINEFEFYSSSCDYIGDIFGLTHNSKYCGTSQAFPKLLSKVKIFSDEYLSKKDYLSNFEIDNKTQILNRDDQELSKTFMKEKNYEIINPGEITYNFDFLSYKTIAIKEITSMNGSYVFIPSSYSGYEIEKIDINLFADRKDMITDIEIATKDVDFDYSIFYDLKNLANFIAENIELKENCFIKCNNIKKIKVKKLDDKLIEFGQIFGMTNNELLNVIPNMTIEILEGDYSSLFKGLTGYLVNGNLVNW